MSGHPIGGGLIQNPISGAITPDYTPAQKIEAVRNTVPGALHLGKREAEAEAYYGGYGGYGLATIGLHGRNPSAYTGPAYGAVVIGKVYQLFYFLRFSRVNNDICYLVLVNIADFLFKRLRFPASFSTIT